MNTKEVYLKFKENNLDLIFSTVVPSLYGAEKTGLSI